MCDCLNPWDMTQTYYQNLSNLNNIDWHVITEIDNIQFI